MSEGFEEFPNIVIDNGSGFIRAGFCNDIEPQAIVSTSIMPKRKLNYLEPLDQNTKNPIERGTITNITGINDLWSNIFYNELRVQPENHSVLLAISPLETKINKLEICRIMFETFNINSLYITSNAALSLYASGKSTGVVLHSDEGITYAVPIYNKKVIHHAVKSLNIGGRDITNYLMNLLSNDNISFSEADRPIVYDIKNCLAYVAEDFEEELNNYYIYDKSKNYELPDGQVISVSSESFKCTEALFKPSLINSQDEGIHQILFNSIMSCDVNIRSDLFENIVLSGENTMFAGLKSRLLKEIKNLAQFEKNITIVEEPERDNMVWRGGSILASLATFQHEWINKMDYEHEKDKIYEAIYSYDTDANAHTSISYKLDQI
jgi:actin-related protein